MMLMTARSALILDGARRALEVRRQFSIDKNAPIDPINLATRLGIQVWFRDATYDGVYSAGAPPIIVLASNRPLGRTAFTCAHEIGHHVFGHGATVEEVVDSRDDAVVSQTPDEILANAFAANLLMPRSVVVHALSSRSLSASTMSPRDVLRVASWLGVGYASLIDHMHHQLKMLSAESVAQLKKREPRTTKANITGVEGGRHDAVLIDAQWGERHIECRIDDYVCSSTTLPTSLLTEGLTVGDGTAHRAYRTGEETVPVNATTIPLRVGRRGRTCRAIYMYEPEEDE